MKKFVHFVSARIWGDHLPDLYGVINQEVVQYELPQVNINALWVIPEAVEAQDFAVMVQELLQRIMSLIWPKWLHTLFELRAWNK